MTWKRCLIGLAAITLIGPAGYVLAQQEQQEQAAETTEAETKNQADKDVADKKEPRKLKIFELKHAAPSQFAQLLSYPHTVQAHAGFYARGTTPHAAVVTLQTSPADGSLPPHHVNVAFDDDKGLLFVRGPADQIDRIEKLVKALNVSPDKLEKQTIGKLHLVPLRHSEVGQVQGVLSRLGMSAYTVQLGKASIVLVREGDEDEFEQIQQVIAKFEKAAKPSEETAAAETSAAEQERR